MTTAETPILGTDEAAKRLGVARSTLTRMVTAGKVEPLHKGAGRTSSYTFRSDEIERIAQERGR
jgi:excisionase family DNA binding protein